MDWLSDFKSLIVFNLVTRYKKRSSPSSLCSSPRLYVLPNIAVSRVFCAFIYPIQAINLWKIWSHLQLLCVYNWFFKLLYFNAFVFLCLNFVILQWKRKDGWYLREKTIQLLFQVITFCLEWTREHFLCCLIKLLAWFLCFQLLSKA